MSSYIGPEEATFIPWCRFWWRFVFVVGYGLVHHGEAVVLSLQPSVLRLGLLQDGDVGVGVFSESKEILERRATSTQITTHLVGAGESQIRECALGGCGQDVSVINDVLKLMGGFASLLRTQVCLSSNVDQLDPNFALAYDGLAAIYGDFGKNEKSIARSNSGIAVMKLPALRVCSPSV